MSANNQLPTKEELKKYKLLFSILFLAVPLLPGLIVGVLSQDIKTGFNVYSAFATIWVIFLIGTLVIRPYMDLADDIKDSLIDLFTKIVANLILAAIPLATIWYIASYWSGYTMNLKLISILGLYVLAGFAINVFFKGDSKK